VGGRGQGTKRRERYKQIQDGLSWEGLSMNCQSPTMQDKGTQIVNGLIMRRESGKRQGRGKQIRH
jgi:hypothetical protein